MHIPDGLLIPINPATHTINVADTAVLIATWAITIPFSSFCVEKNKKHILNQLRSNTRHLERFGFRYADANFSSCRRNQCTHSGRNTCSNNLGPLRRHAQHDYGSGNAGVLFR